MIGLIVNPIAGMGGKVGLKGTDGKVEEAIELGATMVARERVKEFLDALRVEEKFLAAPGEMGVKYLEGKEHEVVKKKKFRCYKGTKIPKTNSEDTKKYAGGMVGKVRIIVFVGGDGTARDVFGVVGEETPILGVPCGVKDFSSVFGDNPKDCAEVLERFLKGELATERKEIMDIDEGAYRRGELKAELVGYARVPYTQELVPGSKEATGIEEEEEQKAIAKRVVEDLEDGIYLLGAGTTVEKVAEELGVKNSLLGVDVVNIEKEKPALLKKDANEGDLLEILKGFKGRKKIVLSPIGRQGFILGRGNQQISGKVLEKFEKDDLIIIATSNKLRECKLRVDVSPGIDEKFRGVVNVITGYHESKVVEVQ